MYRYYLFYIYLLVCYSGFIKTTFQLTLGLTMLTKKFPVLVSYSLKTASWNHDVSTLAHTHQVILVPESHFSSEYINSIEFHNRALQYIASKQYADDNQNKAYTVTDGLNIDHDVTVFMENQKNDYLNSDERYDFENNFFNNCELEFYSEYEDEQGLVQITTDIEIYAVREISESEFNFMSLIATPCEDLNTSMMYALKTPTETF